MYFSVVCDCAFCCEKARLADQPLFVDWRRGGWQDGGVAWSWWAGEVKGKGAKRRMGGSCNFFVNNFGFRCEKS